MSLEKQYDEILLLEATKAYLLAKRGEKREVKDVLIDEFCILVEYEDPKVMQPMVLGMMTICLFG